MRISAPEYYGLRCILALAQTGVKGQLSIPEVAEKEGLSVPYASKLLSVLRQTGLVRAVRGRGGGFCIARQPDRINLLEVITALGGPLMLPNHCSRYSGQLEKCIHTGSCSVQSAWLRLAGHTARFLRSITLDDILRGSNLDDTPEEELRVFTVDLPPDDKADQTQKKGKRRGVTITHKD